MLLFFSCFYSSRAFAVHQHLLVHTMMLNAFLPQLTAMLYSALAVESVFVKMQDDGMSAQ